MTLLSVISSVSQRGSMPLAVSMAATCPTSTGSSRLRAEMFTATPTWRPASCHRRSASRELRRTFDVSALIRPLASASGTNSAGDACGECAVSGSALQSAGYLDEDRVARVVTEGVVDLVEPVDVEQQQYAAGRTVEHRAQEGPQ